MRTSSVSNQPPRKGQAIKPARAARHPAKHLAVERCFEQILWVACGASDHRIVNLASDELADFALTGRLWS